MLAKLFLIAASLQLILGEEEEAQVEVGFDDEDASTGDDVLVSPPFGAAFVEVYRLRCMDEISKLNEKTVATYDPPAGKFGIALAALYGARNARLAMQHYTNKERVYSENKKYDEIFKEMWDWEYSLFTHYVEWNNKGSKEAWVNLVSAIHNVYFHPEKLLQYRDILATQEWQSEIRMVLFKENNYGHKSFEISYKHQTQSEDGSVPFVTLNNGYKMPLLGLGTWPLTGAEVEQMIRNALDVGYRLFDTAESYNNEQILGKVINEYIDKGLVKREDIFIMTKVSFEESYGKGVTKKLIEEQLKRLQVDYIDMYMTHSTVRDEQKLQGAWQDMEEMYAAGKLKALGVSNYDVSDLRRLLTYAKVKPTFVQNKFDVFTSGQQAPWTDSILQFAQSNDIIVQGYSPLNSWPHQIPAYWDAHVEAVKNHPAYSDRSTAQIVLRWCIQQGIAVLTRSQDKDRLASNLKVFDFELSQWDMQLITALNTLISPFDIDWMHDIYYQMDRPYD